MEQRKQALAIDAFAAYRLPYGLCAVGPDTLCFATRKAQPAQNRYEHRLWMLRDGRLHRLQTPGGMAGHWWQPGGALLYTAPASARDRRLAQKGLPAITLYEQRPGQEQEPRPLLRLHHDVLRAWALPDGRLLLHLAWDEALEETLQAAAGDEEKAAQLWERQTACIRVESYPFWREGSGFATKQQRLFVWDGEALGPLSAGGIEVEETRLAPSGAGVFYLEQLPGVVWPNRLWYRPLHGGAAVEYSVAGDFCHQMFVPVSDESVLVAGTDGARHGINQNADFYLCTPGGARRLNDEGRYGAEPAVATDLAPPAMPQWCVEDDALYWIGAEGESTHLLKMHLPGGRVEKLTRQPGAVWELARSGGRTYCIAMRGLAGPELYEIEQDGAEKQLSRLNTALEKKYVLQLPQAASVRSRAQTELKGWVLRPPAPPKHGRCPAVLYIHGGPKMLYAPVLHHEMQWLAQQGYAVLYANPSGSDGKGNAFADIRGRYERVFDELMDFLDEVLRQNHWIDAERLAVAGGSFGGFMVNWAVGHTRRFAAAVSQRGFAGWTGFSLLSDIGLLYTRDQAACDALLQAEEAWQRSALASAAACQTPTLFLHGLQDHRCPAAESMQMYAALRQRGVPARLCLFPQEGHGLEQAGRPNSRLLRLQEIHAWLQKYL